MGNLWQGPTHASGSLVEEKGEIVFLVYYELGHRSPAIAAEVAGLLVAGVSSTATLTVLNSERTLDMMDHVTEDETFIVAKLRLSFSSEGG
jgi:hypothetical protein